MFLYSNIPRRSGSLSYISLIGLIVAFFSSGVLLGGCAANPPNDSGPSASHRGVISELNEICAKAVCRPDTNVRLVIDSQHVYRAEVFRSPYVFADNVNLLPGEQIYFEGTPRADGYVEDIHLVATPINPERTFCAYFAQVRQGNRHQGMLLKMESPFAGSVIYDASIVRIRDRMSPIEVPTCPIHQGRPALEIWDEPILQIILSDFKVIEDELSLPSHCAR